MTPVVRKSLRQVEVLYLDKRPAPCGVGDDFENRHELSPALLQTPVGKHGVPLEGFVVLEIPSRRKPRGPPAQAESGRDPADARALRSATNQQALREEPMRNIRARLFTNICSMSSHGTRIPMKALHAFLVE